MTVTLIGNVGQDPDLRFTPTGKAVASFSLAVTPRSKNGTSGRWEDGETTWYRITAWDQMAEEAAELIHKGQRLIVVTDAEGIQQREYDKRDGTKGVSIEATAEEIGQVLTKRFGLKKADREPAADPWATQEAPF